MVLDDSEELFLRFADMVSSEFERWNRESALPTLARERVTFEDTGWSVTHTDEVLYDVALDTIEKDPVADTCARSHLETGLIRPPAMTDNEGMPIDHPAYHQTRPWIVRHLFKVVTDAVREASSLRPPRELLLMKYRLHRELWAAKDRLWKLTAPLMNFDSDISATELKPDIWLRPLTSAEKSEVFPFNMITMMRAGGDDVRTARYALTGSFRIGGGPFSVPQEFVDEGVNLVSSLRLLHAGDVGFRRVFCSPSDLVLPSDSGHVLGPFASGARIYGSVYRLEATQLPAVLALRDEIARAKAAGRLAGLQVAMRRFDLSYERQGSEDRLIDLTIALEASLLMSISTELSYRLSRRGAALLSYMRKPEETSALLETMYDVRSKIVHEGGGFSQPSIQKEIRRLSPGVTPDSFIQEAEEVVRQVLRRYVELLAVGPETVNGINDTVEARILSSLGFRPDR